MNRLSLTGTFSFTFLPLMVMFMSTDEAKAQNDGEPKFGFVIHGGAGSVYKGRFSAEEEQAYEESLKAALYTGYEILGRGGAGIDAVEAAIRIMENSPMFNAGKGAVFTREGKNELDASIMDGATLKAGAVAGVTRIKNPISAARTVMEKSPHVMMIGDGAEQFAQEQGLELVTPDYFRDGRRYEEFREQLRKKLDTKEGGKGSLEPAPEEAFPEKYGTVGAVALDMNGNLAAGTSTGGMSMKMYGRVGDSPIIGAGTFADNKTCAISSTGHGEYFMRTVLAHRIAMMMEYGHLSLKEAASSMIQTELRNLGGSGGVIGIDKEGNIALEWNTRGMFRAYKLSDGRSEVLLY